MTNPILRACLSIGSAAALIAWTASASFGLEVTKPVPTERREPMSLADAVVAQARGGDVVIVMGAGSIGNVAPRVVELAGGASE